MKKINKGEIRVKIVLAGVVGLAALLFLFPLALNADTCIDAVVYSSDITAVLSGVTANDEDVAEDDLTGTVTLVDVGSLPNATDVSGYHLEDGGDQLLSFDTTVSLPGGLIAGPGDVVRFDGTNYALAFDAAANGLPSGVMVDAVSTDENGDLLLSFDITVFLDGNTVEDEDLVRFGGMSFGLFFDGSAKGVSEALDLDGAHYARSGGTLMLSFDGSGKVGGVTFDDEDVLEYNAGDNSWTLVYDGSNHHANWAAADLDALYVKEADTDGDGILDTEDNCPEVPNADQADTDGDGEGDACDPDDDNDGVLDTSDNCPFVPNSDQADNDLDTIGDVCDPDDDNDGIEDGNDNCPFDANPDQADLDGDGLGDVCDADPDGDGIGEGDNCLLTPNPDQSDIDGDGQGDACDSDDDNDGVLDTSDNCPEIANADQADLDGDNIGDACDSDLDGDGVENDMDNCPSVANVGQDDTDGDGEGDVCDPDDDNDGVLDEVDNCPLMANSDQADSDGDGQGDVCDGDIDGDGVENGIDNCPLDPNANQNDWDGDGAGDVCDDDMDGDGVSNDNDVCEWTPIGEVADPTTGCSLVQLCPCEGPRGTTVPWKNHGKYVSCVAKSSQSFLDQGLISETEKDAIVSAAAESSCGHKK